ncbi:TonB family protein [Ferrimonas balearica DSM 9799]|uniref:Protein TonB n=1 Tax=Ferrimonas balearica (strain DSM 9799 / CCM 4581 / KCTC 23876 / PAT) TaxID=550540 RepID=E1SL63_FERBD|nr:energy transducer TonB [Ferrimonas balearica]ADN75441.1 TonB family protein [Ferrimonas balearica DSM 9799]
MHTDTSWLWPALLLTLALHALLLMPTPPLVLPKPGVTSISPMAVSLLAEAALRPAKPTPPKAAPEPKPAPRPKPQPKLEPRPEPKPQPVVQPKPRPVAPSTPVAPPPTQAMAVTEPIPTNDTLAEAAQSDQAHPEPNAAPPLQGKPALTAPPVQPRYPRAAKRRGLQGEVWIEVWLDSHGQQTHIEVLTSSGVTQLDDSALVAVAQWQFAPMPGVDESRVRVPVRFELN